MQEKTQVTLTPGGICLYFQLNGKPVAAVPAHSYNLATVLEGIGKALDIVTPIGQHGPTEAWSPSPQGRKFFDDGLRAMGLEPANPSIQVVDL